MRAYIHGAGKKPPPLAEDEPATHIKHLLIIGAPDATFIRSNLVGEIAFERPSQKLNLESGPARDSLRGAVPTNGCPGGYTDWLQEVSAYDEQHDETMPLGERRWKEDVFSGSEEDERSLHVHGRVRGKKEDVVHSLRADNIRNHRDYDVPLCLRSTTWEAASRLPFFCYSICLASILRK